MKTGMGTWIHHAKEKGWTSPGEARIERWEQWPDPPIELETVEDFQARVVIIGRRFFDRLMHDFISSVDELGTLIATVKFPKPKTAKTLTAAIRHDQARKKAQRFTAAAFMPREGREVLDRMPNAAGHLRHAPGARLFNLWQPPRIPEGPQPVPDVWLAKVREICPDDPEYVLDWMAIKVQGHKIGAAIVLGGTPGSGKDLILGPIKRGLSPHVAETDIRQLDGDFAGDVLAEKTLVVVQEARGGGGARDLREREAAFRLLIAIGEPFVVNRKNRPQTAIPNVADYVFTMNEIDGLHIPPDDRRYAVFWTDAPQMTEADYAAYTAAYSAQGGDDAVIAYLARRRVKLKPGAPAPMTPAKLLAQQSSLTMHARKIAPEVRKRITPLAWVTVDALKAELWTAWEGEPDRLDNELGAILKALGWVKCPHWRDGRAEVAGTRFTVWQNPTDPPRPREAIRQALKAEKTSEARIRALPTDHPGPPTEGSPSMIIE
ncbi:hypothetical protein HKCCE3408_05095 [Rhodobacterales bacterium HKCCE3408]|nr:hypothetical protein [Rhodobacterales bacterium HKCCE3408]